jgi:hypothetical protein
MRKITHMDYKNISGIVKELKTQRIMEFIDNNNYNWNNHIRRMTPSKIPFQILRYQVKKTIFGKTFQTLARNRCRRLMMMRMMMRMYK